MERPVLLRASSGYEIVDVNDADVTLPGGKLYRRPGGVYRVIRGRDTGNDDAYALCQVHIDSEGDLFKVFANLQYKENDIVKFANKFGLLGGVQK